MSTERRNLEWEALAAQLPANFEELAKEYGVIRTVPEHLNAKIKDASTLLRLIFAHVLPGLSLVIATGQAAATGVVNISAVGLHKRMRKSGFYLAALCAELMALPSRFSRDRWAGYEVCLLDGTSISGPASAGTDARVHLGVRLNDLSLVYGDVTSNRVGETLKHIQAKPGQLWIGDRAYAGADGLASIKRDGADALVRYGFGNLPLFNGRGELIDVMAKLRTITKAGRYKEWNAVVHASDGTKVTGRLCAFRLPEAKAEKAIARLRREHGKDISPVSLEAAKYVVVFTTVPRERLSTKQVLELYRLRWQVELLIKRDKSIIEMGNLPNKRPDTIYSWVTAKLLGQLLLQRLSMAAAGVPPSAA